MDVKRENSSTLVISEDVIAKIASIAALEVSGIAGVVPKPVDIKRFIKKDHPEKSVLVSAGTNETVIDIYLKLKMGAKISEVVEQVQHDIKESVQNMTSRVVTKVNVHVMEIDLESQEKAE